MLFVVSPNKIVRDTSKITENDRYSKEKWYDIALRLSESLSAMSCFLNGIYTVLKFNQS